MKAQEILDKRKADMRRDMEERPERLRKYREEQEKQRKSRRKYWVSGEGWDKIMAEIKRSLYDKNHDQAFLRDSIPDSNSFEAVRKKLHAWGYNCWISYHSHQMITWIPQ